MAYLGDRSYKAQYPDMATIDPDVPKPEELSLLDSLMALGVMPKEGGYFDQPWLLIKSLEAAASAKNMFMQPGLLQESQDEK